MIYSNPCISFAGVPGKGVKPAAGLAYCNLPGWHFA